MAPVGLLPAIAWLFPHSVTARAGFLDHPRAAGEVVVGDIRVQALSQRVVRVEQRGPLGFEDRPTFLVVNRSWPEVPHLSEPSATASGGFVVSSPFFTVEVSPAPRLADTCYMDTSITGGGKPYSSIYAADAGECCAACDADPNCAGGWLYHGKHAQEEAPMQQESSGATSTCDSAQQDVDVTGPKLLSAYTHEQMCNMTLEECCATCDSDDECMAFTHTQPSSWSVCPHQVYCFLLSGFSGTTTKVGNVFAQKAPAPPAPTPPPPAPPSNCKLLEDDGFFNTKHSWNGAAEVFGCPRRGCGSPLEFYVTVSDPQGNVLGSSAHAAAPFRFPDPGNLPGIFALRDENRIVVPDWGATPAPASVDPALAAFSGYDARNRADDIYLFLVKDHEQLRRDFLTLTGPVPLLPDWAMGTWFTEWHYYTGDEALEEIKKWDQYQLPLDVWGLDMNWRGAKWTGGDVGQLQECYYNYTNTTLFPNGMEPFIAEEHKLGKKTYFNDHPCKCNLRPPAPVLGGDFEHELGSEVGWACPNGQDPSNLVSPSEIAFRYEGLTSMLNKGLDFWWYDPNWYVGIAGTMQLDNEVWGGHQYTSVLKQYRDDQGSAERPIMLGMVGSTHAAHHRYPVWWTGDNPSLDFALRSMVDYGVAHLKPYVHSDCGGNGNSKTYLQWTQTFALGTILRFHGSLLAAYPNNSPHQPWAYDNETLNTARTYLDMRYKLMPTLLAAVARASEDGMPIVRRLDLAFPDQKEATRNDQYLLADDLLVAPLTHGSSREVWIPPGGWEDAWTGEVLEGPKLLQVTPTIERMPMWHRQGGAIVTVPGGALSVTAQDWSALVVEAFPGVSGQTVDRRVVREGQAPALLRIEHRLLGEAGGERVVVDVIDGASTSRRWLLRVHLRPGHRASHVTLDGAVLTATQFRHLEPEGNEVCLPFGGEGAAPPVGAGPILEVSIASSGGARRAEVRIEEFTIEV